jgi:hypothetical protein
LPLLAACDISVVLNSQSDCLKASARQRWGFHFVFNSRLRAVAGAPRWPAARTPTCPDVGIRGDFKDAAGVSKNRLRQWEVSDVVPRPDDILQERLIAIQWMDKETLQSARPRSFFASVTEADRDRERKAIEFVESNLAHWQDAGLVPDMPIETGKENEGPIRTNGWTHWHHLFSPLQLIFFATLSRHVRRHLPTGWLDIARLLDRSSKVNRWSSSNGSSGQPTNVFDTQALNTFFNYCAYPLTGTPAIPDILAQEVSARCHRRVAGIALADLLLDHDGFLDCSEVAHGRRREHRRPSRVFEPGCCFLEEGHQTSEARRRPLQSASQDFAIRCAERLRKITAEAPLQSLFVAFLLGIWVARRR